MHSLAKFAPKKDRYNKKNWVRLVKGNMKMTWCGSHFNPPVQVEEVNHSKGGVRWDRLDFHILRQSQPLEKLFLTWHCAGRGDNNNICANCCHALFNPWLKICYEVKTSWELHGIWKHGYIQSIGRWSGFSALFLNGWYGAAWREEMKKKVPQKQTWAKSPLPSLKLKSWQKLRLERKIGKWPEA